ncbi:RES domain-containing protein [Mycolicibacterium sp. S2-37]|uniref:RES family NAD+ phosphorylase n=1 Tax=Mycolicibacterium sp. S2-37 TaxID=2810297 RepID=UPI001A93F97B|nr:RES family NAD+ phosphorylase [Mycolicibacterium sp. S2-37]MBO0676169.1 RES domain-containing protein [Mycolicibacterium sp. S2-37]
MPELLAGYLQPLPAGRPAGLRSRTVRPGTTMWRIESSVPDDWDWRGFPQPRYRFDPQTGAFRTRYAGADLVGAFRERYRGTGLVIPGDHAEHHLIEMVTDRPMRVLDLRTERNLDALDVDDQISTGQHDAVWDTCQRLADRCRLWWPDLDAIVYRSRTTPQQSTNYAFFAHDHFRIRAWRLADRLDALTELVLRHGFTVDWPLNG